MLRLAADHGNAKKNTIPALEAGGPVLRLRNVPFQCGFPTLSVA